MKNKWILWIALSSIMIIIGLMIFDLFSDKQSTQNNYEYKLDKFKALDSTKICYSEIKQVKTNLSDCKAIAIDNQDNIYLSANHFIVKYNPSGDSISSFTSSDTAFCIALDKKGDLFLAYKNYIEHYNTKGKLIKKWEPINKTAWITSIAVADSFLFAADAGNKIIHRFNLKGELTAQIGKKDKEKGIPGFFIPSPYFDVLIDKNNQLWAINTGRHAFEAYTFDGELITRWERTSMSVDGFSGCCNPTHVAILSDGSFVTSEKGIVRIKIHEKTGDFKCIVAGANQFNEAVTGLDLAVDSKNRILVLDPSLQAIRIFEKTN